MRVGLTAEVEHAGEPGDTDRHIGEAHAPGASERVRHDHGNVHAIAGPQRVAYMTGRSVGVDREQGGMPVLHVGEVDARIGAHEAVQRLADHEVAAAPHDAHRLGLHERAPRVAIVGIEPTSRPSAFETPSG